MSKTLREMFDKAQHLELDKGRKLMLTVYAWMHLEDHYGSMAGALRSYAEMMSGHHTLSHVVRWLHALVQEEIRQSNKTRKPKDWETVTVEDIEQMIHLDRMIEYKARITDTIKAYYPAIQNPPAPALGETDKNGHGSGQENS